MYGTTEFSRTPKVTYIKSVVNVHCNDNVPGV